MINEEIIVGFGKTGFSPKARVMIDVIIAKYSETGRIINGSIDIKTCNIDYAHSLRIHAPFNNTFGNVQPQTRHMKKSVKFDPKKTRIVRYGEIPQIQRILKKHGCHKLNQLGLMWVLWLEEQNIVVPCPAIASYYLCHTSLIEAAFTEPNIYNCGLFKYNKSLLNHHTPLITLNQRTPKKIAPHIARICLDPFAKSVYSEILAKSMHSTDELSPSLYMRPLSNKTLHWNLLGFILDDKNPIFCATSILSCNSEFPLSDLIIEKDKTTYVGKGVERQERERTNHKPNSNTPPQFRPGAKINVFTEFTEIKDESFIQEYPGVNDIKIKSIDRVIKKDRDKKIIYTDINTSYYDILSSGGDIDIDEKNVLPARVCNNFSEMDNIPTENVIQDPEKPGQKEPSKNAKINTFLNAIDLLSEKYSCQQISLDECETLVPPLDESVLPYDSAFFDIAWCRRNKVKDKKVSNPEIEWHKVSRRFMTFHLYNENIDFYLVEFIYGWRKGDTGCTLLIGDNKGKLQTDHIYQAIRSYALNRGDWPKGKTISTFPLSRKIKHEGTGEETSNDTPEKFKSRVEAAIKKQLKEMNNQS